MDAIILNPTDREGLTAVLESAISQASWWPWTRLATRKAYVVTNDQVAYAQNGAEWLFETPGGAGKVVEMRY
ncbi:MAG: hypothetical protein R3A10_11225 [Caldilineaceae bacterium]